MAAPALFVGVVSHEGSRFSVSQGPHGLAYRLADSLPGVEVQVNTSNLLDEAALPVTAAMVQAMLGAELRLDRAWSRYLGRPMGPRWWAVHAARSLRRGWQRLSPPDVSVARRLLNIELSHLDLMRRGLDSQAPWVLILEDDAFATDIADVASGLAGLMSASPAPAFVNLSASFSNAALGIEHLLSPVPGLAWDGVEGSTAAGSPRVLLQASRPVTNTVCAILYSRAFLVRLVDAMEALPMEPLVPIDWKLNLALMRMFAAGQIGAGDCCLVEPAPITQMSMQPAGILPS